MTAGGRTHTDAVLALLEPAITTYDGKVHDEAPPSRYVVLYADDGMAARARLTPTSSTLDCEFQLTAVGTSRQQAQWAADTARAAVLDVRPSIPGRQTTPIRQTVSRPVDRDDDVTPPLFYAVALYAFRSVPAQESS